MCEVRDKLVSSLRAYSAAGLGAQISADMAGKLARWIEASEARIDGAQKVEAAALDMMRRANRRLFVALCVHFAGLALLALAALMFVAGASS